MEKGCNGYIETILVLWCYIMKALAVYVGLVFLSLSCVLEAILFLFNAQSEQSIYFSECSMMPSSYKYIVMILLA